MQPLYVLEAVDVRRADETGSSRALTITKLGLPSIKRQSAEHNPGGGVGQVSFTFPQIEKVEPKFELKGFDVNIIKSFGLAAGTADKWVFAGALRDKRSGLVLAARAIIQGVVAEWSPDEHSAGDLMGCNHALQEVTHYEFQLAGEELWYWDFFEREGRAGGVSWMAPLRTALGG